MVNKISENNIYYFNSTLGHKRKKGDNELTFPEIVLVSEIKGEVIGVSIFSYEEFHNLQDYKTLCGYNICDKRGEHDLFKLSLLNDITCSKYNDNGKIRDVLKELKENGEIDFVSLINFQDRIVKHANLLTSDKTLG